MNGHHTISDIEGEELVSTVSQQALELLFSLEEKIEGGILDPQEYVEALQALRDIRDDSGPAPSGYRQHLLSAATQSDRASLENLKNAIESARPIRTARWGLQQPTSRKWLVEDWLPAGRVTC